MPKTVACSQKKIRMKEMRVENCKENYCHWNSIRSDKTKSKLADDDEWHKKWENAKRKIKIIKEIKKTSYLSIART